MSRPKQVYKRLVFSFTREQYQILLFMVKETYQVNANQYFINYFLQEYAKLCASSLKTGRSVKLPSLSDNDPSTTDSIEEMAKPRNHKVISVAFAKELTETEIQRYKSLGYTIET